MAGRTHTVHDSGMEGLLVTVECQSSNGLPGMIIVGLANKAVDESKERIRSAFTSSNIPFPRKRLTLNLAPADEPKDSSSLDLSMALAILLSNSASSPKTPISTLVSFGELSLDGIIRPVRGIIGKISSAKRMGFLTALVPVENASQASLISGVRIVPVRNLKEVVSWLFENQEPKFEMIEKRQKDNIQQYPDFSEVVGHHLAKRSLEIAAAGKHNILLNGPPGTGKSMLAKAMAGILPPLDTDQIIETSHLHSLVDRKFENVINTPPFRDPHHSASSVAIIGGGQHAKPGEISLAHNGVLFLDELPEYARDCLEALRQPLEDHRVHISRARQSVSYPANFILVATKNPCPCGNYGSNKPCTCSAHDISRYNRKLSGPILDRIDIHTEVDEVPYHLIGNIHHDGDKSQDIMDRVIAARKIQVARNPGGMLNAALSNKDFSELGLATPEAIEFLASAAERIGISTRGFIRTLRVARTIADLAGNRFIEKSHVAEALQMRPKTIGLI